MNGLELLDQPEFVKIAKALADPTRLRIYGEIVRSERICCGEVGRRFPVTQATVSHHLRILADAGLVETAREGQFVHVRPRARTLSRYQGALAELVDAATACEVRATEEEPERVLLASDQETVVARLDAEATSPAARRAMRRAGSGSLQSDR